MAIAQKGNLKDYGEFLTTYKRNVVNDFMKLIDKNIKIDKLSGYKFELYQFTNRKTNEPDYILGFWTTEDVDTKIGVEQKNVFRAIWAVQVAKREISLKQYKNVINIDGVFTDEDRAFRSKGISTFMYQYLVNKLHFTILGDLEQYFKLNIICSDKYSTPSLSHKQLEILKYIVRAAHKKFTKHKLVAIQSGNKDEITLVYIGVKLKPRAQNKFIRKHNAKFRKTI